mmetsp:Transcript_45393/g.33178  ORF Transcript_45393/g.33178 Transcript_45393/m.33178 type:complete len:176 (+) Transcript_45393:468-995(+)
MERKGTLKPAFESKTTVRFKGDARKSMMVTPANKGSVRSSEFASNIGTIQGDATAQNRKTLPPLETGPIKIGIESMQDILELKFLLTKPIAVAFNSNVLRIALNMQEEKIASVIIGLYNAKVDEEMILRSVKTSQVDFLYSMFAYNKNYEEVALFNLPKPMINMSEGNNTDSEHI